MKVIWQIVQEDDNSLRAVSLPVSNWVFDFETATGPMTFVFWFEPTTKNLFFSDHRSNLGIRDRNA